MKNLQLSAVCVALSAALLTPVAFAQSTQPMQPAIPSADPTTTGQPAAPTSPAEVRPPPPAAVGTMPPPPGTAAPMAPSPEGLPPPPKVMRAGSVEYMSGGAGEESRAAIESMQGRFGLRNVFSGKGGEYVVPEKVTVQGASGPATEIANAGPILVMALPPGKYTIEAAVGGKVQRKTFTLAAGQPVKLNWNWPGA